MEENQENKKQTLNHFIEVGLDINNDYWVTIHTGSRNFGKRICEYWQGIAEKGIRQDRVLEKQSKIDALKLQYTGEELYEKIREIKQQYNFAIDIKGMEFIENENAHGYLFDMIFAQAYAKINREYIMKSIVNEFKLNTLNSIETIHNFIDFRDFIIRKGAIRAYIGESMIIPFNMRDGLLICEGKSNPEWNYSAPHGAGRVLSRSKAKQILSVDSFKEQMSGIYSTSVGYGTIDEAPDAYKDAKMIEKAIEPTAQILNRVVPVINLKAKDSIED